MRSHRKHISRHTVNTQNRLLFYYLTTSKGNHTDKIIVIAYMVPDTVKALYVFNAPQHLKLGTVITPMSRIVIDIKAKLPNS